jgi:hypothetical protein
MAKKKNKSQSVADLPENAIPPSLADSTSTSVPKPKETKIPQPSTSALIICRNKYAVKSF